MYLNEVHYLAPRRPLLPSCVEGDRHSQSQLYAMSAPGMFTVCLRYSRNREEAEEVMQEGFLKVFRNLHQFQKRGSFQGWIRKIMINTALEKFRSKPNLYPLLSIDGLEENLQNDFSFEYILHELDAKDLILMIQHLPIGYRMVFNLHIFEGMKHREISESLGISEGTSKSNLHDARKILQAQIAARMTVASKNGS